jgi:hypothetical protein
VKVDWLLVEVASLTVGGCYEARPVGVLVVGCWCLQVGAGKQVSGDDYVVVRRRLSSRRVF